MGLLAEKWGDWLLTQDIPTPIIPKLMQPGHRPQLSPTAPSQASAFSEIKDPDKEKSRSTPRRQNTDNRSSATIDEGVFQMDGDLPLIEIPKPSPAPTSTSIASPNARRVWKSQAVAEKASIKSIIEAEELAAISRRPSQAVNTVLGTPTPEKWTGWSSKPTQSASRGVSQPNVVLSEQLTPPSKLGLAARTESSQVPSSKQTGSALKNVTSITRTADSRTPTLPGLGPLIVPTKNTSGPAQPPKRRPSR